MENVITEIKWQKRKRDRASVYIDGEFAFGAPAIVIAELRLKVGQTVDAESMSAIVAEAERDGAWNDALKYVSRSVRSVREIRDYLARKEYEPSAITYAVDKLLDYGYADDAAYAKAYVSDHCARSGKKKLEFELKQKGVARSIVTAVLSEVEELPHCLALAQKYAKGKVLDYATKAKLANYLYSKGFDWDVVHEVVDEMEDSEQ